MYKSMVSQILDLINHNKENVYGFVDLRDVSAKMKTWKQLLPQIRPFFAVKCFDDPVLIAHLHRLGVGFDCASRSEIKHVLAAAGCPEDIVFANPIKLEEDMREAREAGVRHATFDSVGELEKQARTWPDAELMLRITGSQTFLAEYELGSKFGAHSQDFELLLSRAKELRLTVVGIAFHVGSGCLDCKAFSHHIKVATHAFEIARQLGFNPRILDIGGGYIGRRGTSIANIALEVKQAVAECFPNTDSLPIMISEPGRYFVESAVWLAAKVIGKVERRSSTTVDYYLSTGNYGCFMVYSHYEHREILPTIYIRNGIDVTSQVTEQSLRRPGRLLGPTCDQSDLVLKLMIPELECGDWLVWSDMGNYDLPICMALDWLPRPAIHCITVEDAACDCKEI